MCQVAQAIFVFSVSDRGQVGHKCTNISATLHIFYAHLRIFPKQHFNIRTKTYWTVGSIAFLSCYIQHESIKLSTVSVIYMQEEAIYLLLSLSLSLSLFLSLSLSLSLLLILFRYVFTSYPLTIRFIYVNVIMLTGNDVSTSLRLIVRSLINCI